MNLLRRIIAGAASVLILLVASSTWGATQLSNTFTGFTGDSSQAGTQAALAAAGFSVFNTAGYSDNGTPGDPGDDSNPAVTFDAEGAHFGSLIAGDAGRNFIRSIDSDYANFSFTAEITFKITNDSQAVFFGMGSGDTALFGTPDWSTQLSSASFWPEPGNDKITVFRTANDVNGFVDKAIPGFDVGTHRFRMTFDHVTGLLVGSIDLNYAGGPFVADATTLPIATKSGASPLFAADGWPSEPSRIFFGGDDGAIVGGFDMPNIPEPASAGLLLVACSAFTAMRRQLLRSV